MAKKNETEEKILVNEVGQKDGVKFGSLKFDLAQFDLDPDCIYRVVDCTRKPIYLDKDKIDPDNVKIIFNVIKKDAYEDTYNTMKENFGASHADLMVKQMGFEIESVMSSKTCPEGFDKLCTGKDVQFINFAVYPKWVSRGQSGSYSAVKVCADLATDITVGK